MNISLRLSSGRKIPLSSGAKVNAADLPGLHSVPVGGPVAIVSSHPTDSSIQGLQNLSQQSWRAHLANGESVEIKPGKNVRLTPGTRISFGSIQGEVECAAQQAAGRKGNAWLWAGVGSAVLCLLIAGGWYIRYQVKAAVPSGLAAPEEQHVLDKPQETGPKVAALLQEPDRATPVNSPAHSQTRPQAVPTSLIAKNLPASSGIYGMQDLIEFDCLDGASFDPKSGSLSLFGHWQDPERPLWIPYFDYLATALDCKAPTFSLEWTPSSYPIVDRVLKTGGEAILNSVSKLFDDEGRLTSGGAWLLQQARVPVGQFMSQETTLVRMLYAANHPKTAQVVDQLNVWLDSKEGISDADLARFCQMLGIGDAYRDFDKQRQPGTVPEDRLMDQFFLKLLVAIGDGLESNGSNDAARYRQARANGKSPLQAFQEAQRGLTKNFRILVGRSLDELMGKVSEIPVPSSVIREATGGAVPKVRPVSHDLPPRSVLARTAFQADMAAKLITCAPQLKTRIPGYKTEFEFAREKAHSADVGYERFWIAPGTFELAQSRDGNTVRFTSSSMVFNARGVDLGPSHSRTDTTDPIPIDYAAELTKQYDALAQEIPILHALRESEKVIAISRWIQKRGFAVRLPKAGRTEWSPPQEIAGIIHLVLSVHNGKAIANSAAEGGIDLRNDPTIRDAVADKPPAGASATVPTVPDNLAGQEQNIRQRLAQASNPKDQAALKIELAKLLAMKGDILGSTKELNEALRLDPNVQGQMAVYRAWMQPQNPNSPGPSQAPAANTTGGGLVKLTPFQWPAPASPSSLNGPEESLKANSDLKDIQIQPFQYHPLLPPPAVPPVPQKLLKDPTVKREMEDFMKAWEQSNQQYGDAATANPAKAEQIKHDVEEHTKKFVEKLKKEHPGDFGLDIEEGVPGPETGSEANPSVSPESGD